MKRYAITIHPTGNPHRQLMTANQSHNFYDTRETAFAQLEALRTHETRETVNSVFGAGSLATLAVSEIDCWDTGDAKGIYWNNTLPEPSEEVHIEPF